MKIENIDRKNNIYSYAGAKYKAQLEILYSKMVSDGFSKHHIQEVKRFLEKSQKQVDIVMNMLRKEPIEWDSKTRDVEYTDQNKRD